jgi:serine/threonine-protein kinase
VARDVRRLIEGYELLEKLGEGGMGGVYLARKLSTGENVAIKVLRKSLGRNNAYVDRFVREAKLAAQLDHPHIVKAIEVGASGGYQYLAMEYVEGRSVQKVMSAVGELDEREALRVTLQVTLALDHAWRRGIIHRDIKPDNILLDSKGAVRVTDLGLAREAGAARRLTQSGVLIGTPHYMSPEQVQGEKQIDVRSDIYSLGATLYHMVTGRPPFEGSSAAVVMTMHLSEQLPWPADVNPAVSEHCCQLIQKMMAKDPADRYEAPPELAEDLQRVMAGQRPKQAELPTGKSLISHSGAIQVEPVELPWVKRRREREEAQDSAEAGETPELADTGPLPEVRPRMSPSLPFLIGIGLALLLAGFGLGLLIRVGRRVDREERDRRLRDSFNDAKSSYEGRRLGHDDAIFRFQGVAARGKNTVWEMKAEDAIRRIKDIRREEERTDSK